MNIEENELMTNAILKSDGGIMLFKAVITDISCNFDMTYFPFDQVLSINLSFDFLVKQ